MLVAVAGAGFPVSAAEGTQEGQKSIATGMPLAPVDAPGFRRVDVASERTAAAHSIAENATDEPGPTHIAQFALPPARPGGEFALPQGPQRIIYQYAYGSESPVRYRVNPDLDKRVRDNSLVLLPQLNAYVIYRPTDWFETLLEVIAEREIVREEPVVTLPNGDTKLAQKRYPSLFVDQAYFTIKGEPIEFIAGRRNFEDERRWLYDLSLDAVTTRVKLGNFHADASIAREDLVNLDLVKPVTRGRINYYMLHMEYRGIEDTRLAAYAIRHQDLDGNVGRPLNLGVRAIGFASPELSYWGELAFLRGRDALSRRYSGYAFDVGGTYRFAGAPLNANVTLGYAYSSGNAEPGGTSNRLFRQTGLESNEARFAGISKFKYYGEALDPALSNLGIITMGFGFRPAGNVSVDVVYHRYRLSEIADSLPDSAITAQMNQVDTRLSKDVGSGLDVVVGIRGLFGIRRLGLDLRAGWFFPGKAFVTSDSAGEIRNPDTAMAIVAKFWW
jgi:alginate production protein